MLYTVLRKVTFDGKIIIIDSSNNIREFGKGDRLVKIKLKNKSIEKKLFRNPALHLGEGYMNEEILIQKGTIEELIDIVTACYDDFIRNNSIYRFYENFSGYIKGFSATK
jgi:hypothetical protein